MKKRVADSLLGQVQADYNLIAEHFSQTRNRQWYEVSFLVHQYMKAGERILDLGCGNGRIAEVIDEIKGQYVGMDVSSKLVEQAQKLHPNQEFVVGSMMQLPFEDASFDHVMMIASFHHIPSRAYRAQVLKEVRRILKPGGFLIMTNWNLHQLKFLPLRWKFNLQTLLRQNEMDWNDTLVPWKNAQREIKAQRYYHGFTRPELRRLARMTNFSIVDQYYETDGMHLARFKAHNLVSVFN